MRLTLMLTAAVNELEKKIHNMYMKSYFIACNSRISVQLCMFLSFLQ